MKRIILLIVSAILASNVFCAEDCAKNLKDEKSCDASPCEVKKCDEKIAWQCDVDAAVKKAEENKGLVVFYFTGSDWCSWCAKLDEEVLSKPEFVKYANENVQMVLCDFPKDRNKISKEQLAKNESLARTFKIEGYPTLVIVNPSEKTAIRAGYEAGNTPATLIKKLEDFKANGVHSHTSKEVEE